MGDDVEAGIIPRAVRQVFDTLHSTSHSAGVTRMATVRVSMIELYNDECKDLLHPEIPSRDIMIREDKHGRIFFTGAREEVVTDAESALQYLELGNINRSTAETLMNQASSRSHVCYPIVLVSIALNLTVFSTGCVHLIVAVAVAAYHRPFSRFRWKS